MRGTIVSTDELTLDPGRLTGAARTLVRISFGLSGIAAIILGILLFVIPGRTLQLAAILLGVNFLVAGMMRIWLGAFGRLPGGQHRVLGILFGALLVITGLIILRDSAVAAATLLLIIVLFAGIGWILDGIMAIVESGRAQSRTWAIIFGMVSILAGIVVLAVPGWTARWLIIFAAIGLVVTGVAAVIRAFTFGRGAGEPAAGPATL
ncbi:hypothetical protein GCM10011575_31790 [Microlunatus endophyticus]|uniref:HdeD family acid-resistance protein n=1 Tax=Microlunatus endophyticus TaxID=1716077 RepID=A0A917SD90_9ACTN|nr:DUF308 domain-containing protein [Microlunatus endophyticus]GGL70978.1 hypothetical protein GCM10011575_31790 [Microlunatus endophyticus]